MTDREFLEDHLAWARLYQQLFPDQPGPCGFSIRFAETKLAFMDAEEEDN